MINFSLKIRDVEFKNRIFTASGTFGYGLEIPQLVDVNKIGAIITKSITLKPRVGNPPNRIVETPSGLLNSIGLANIGLKEFLEEKLPQLSSLKTAIIVNIAGNTIEEYGQLVDLMNDKPEIKAFELNLSCPNVKEGGLSLGTNLKTVAEITKLTRTLTKKPIIVKLTPNVTRISDFAKAAESEGADAVSLINTLVGMAIDVKTRKPKLSTITGGLSGPAIKPVALAKVFETVRTVKIPVIGIGGVTNLNDALEFFIAGAKAIQIGTANFINPHISVDILTELEKYCEANGIKNFEDIIGSIDLSDSVSINI